MSKKPEEQPKKFRVIPTQKTFAFLNLTPSFIIDNVINRWMQSLVTDTGAVPMLGKVSEGFLTIHYTYLYTTKLDIQEVEVK